MDNQNLGGLREFIDKFKIPLGLSLVGLVLIIGGVFASNLNGRSQQEFPRESIVESQKLISVDVSGAVQKPGVHKLKDGARIEDAITSAGGFSEKANSEYISKYLNLAQKLSDGSKIYVPFEGETPLRPASPDFAGQGVVAGQQSKININIASQSELEALPGIGPVTASKIISDRPYQKIEDLLNKKIVNKSTFEKIKNSIVVY